jgi:GNAT superfamily N-acetyltransferase
MAAELEFRRYDPRDKEAVVELHEWAMREAGTDPADIPGTDDLDCIEATYLDAGGEFLVGIGAGLPETVPETFDGQLAAMGGFLPNEAGHDDERTVPNSVELHRMRVAPPTQGRGFGRALLAELEKRVEADSYDRLLATTAERQQRALALYRESGYRAVDQSTHGEYELVHFEKPLSAGE